MDYIVKTDQLVNYAASAGVKSEEGYKFLQDLLAGRQKAADEINTGKLTPQELSERKLLIKKVTCYLEKLLLEDRVLSRETKRLIGPSPIQRY
ncbi:MAG: hypothetical protein BRC43_14370 [Cyanobacteria bacterium QS_3_48_167]|nr:MAG: hypothetical protein BRC43_14370 [Cyanobacteria bacterium QS_3_48_167]